MGVIDLIKIHAIVYKNQLYLSISAVFNGRTIDTGMGSQWKERPGGRYLTP